jgi:acetoin utilization deacetylase AcuC-like enzyme
MSDVTALVWSDAFRLHDTGSHPENQRRLDTIRERFVGDGRFERHPLLEPNLASIDDLTLVHTPDHVSFIQQVAERGGGAIDADTWVAPGSFEAARYAAGAALRAVHAVLSGEHRRVWAFPRPPGHHAGTETAMGFCLFNSIAIGAQAALDRHALARVAIVDWDVHHGNGTQEIFYARPDVFFASVHQWPLFPGTGLAHETGVGGGAGYTLNVPLQAGATDADYRSVFDGIVEERVRAFQPDLLMVSAGFDAHRDDPLASMRLTEAGFASLARRVRRWADELTGGRLILLLEGGYNLPALAESVSSVLDALDDPAEG